MGDCYVGTFKLFHVPFISTEIIDCDINTDRQTDEVASKTKLKR